MLIMIGSLSLSGQWPPIVAGIGGRTYTAHQLPSRTPASYRRNDHGGERCAATRPQAAVAATGDFMPPQSVPRAEGSRLLSHAWAVERQAFAAPDTALTTQRVRYPMHQSRAIPPDTSPIALMILCSALP